MSYKRLGMNDIVAAIQATIKGQTNIECYDAVPDNAESPFYFVEVVKAVPANTKTTYQDVFTVWLHAIAEPSDFSTQINNLIQQVQEAMTEDIVLPEPFTLVMQVDSGVLTIKQDETKEKHAVLQFEITVSYGLKCK